MINRIKQIVDHEAMSSSQFADAIGVGRAVVSHVLTGRNKPSLEVITRILETFPHISTEWLMFGKGEMLCEKSGENGQSRENYASRNAYNLFSNEEMSIGSSQPSFSAQESDNQCVVPKEVIASLKAKPDKFVREIIVYYSDNTFEVFESKRESQHQSKPK